MATRISNVNEALNEYVFHLKKKNRDITILVSKQSINNFIIKISKNGVECLKTEVSDLANSKR